ncbi:unnamed protein product [Cyclocybe aegerita]|uniref:Uncharacterized protein n=1 Tax=Cyclocybe aegerita TaxID=1973307 RepID=A0A8S0WRR4_CYCAE|nr:unnamed protein product [Cyclocybe aegerita]
MEEFKEEAEEIGKRLSEAAAEVSQVLTEQRKLEEECEHRNHEQGKTYACTVRTIMIDTTPGLSTNGLAEMDEREIVGKANMALELMAKAGENIPKSAELVGARKMRNGGVLLEMNTVEGAKWLREVGTEGFLERMGGTSVVTERTVTVVVEYVPITFDPSNMEALQRIEKASSLTTNTIAKASYIKPKERRKPGQKVAHIFMSLRGVEDGDKAIRHGLYIKEKKQQIARQNTTPVADAEANTVWQNAKRPIVTTSTAQTAMDMATAQVTDYAQQHKWQSST